MSQLAVIVVTDLVASTELRTRVGEDGADELRRRHDALLADAIAANGGAVVKGLGDGLLARFGGAADAIAAAVRMQQKATRHLTIHGEPLLIRVGIAAGDVSLEDGDVFGTPVIEASRLCGAAAGGQILVADLVRVLAHGRGSHRFTPLGPVHVKGLPDPIETCAVSWSRADASFAVPMPPGLAASQRFGFAARATERQKLGALWTTARLAERQIALIAGEPGIGKTRLARELAHEAADDGAVVLLGRCFEDIQASFAPFTEALTHLVLHAPDDLLASHVAVAGGDLVRIVPDLGTRAAVPALFTGDSELERLRLFEAVVDLLARVSDEAPVLLVLDDLHWADPLTLELLLWLSRSTRPMSLTVIGTYRDTDVGDSNPLSAALAELSRTRASERIRLTGLDCEETKAFLEAAGGGQLDETGSAIAEMLHAETEGNPFFLQELLTHLFDTGTLRREGDHWVASGLVRLAIPDSVRELICRRLSLLEPEANHALRAAAVVGSDFTLDVLTAVTGSALEALLDVLEEPYERGLIEEAGIDHYRFSHALVRQTLYEELGASRRARAHRRVADALAAKGAPPGEVAHHLIEAGPHGDPDQIVALASAAAKASEQHLAWEEACTWYQQAQERADAAQLGQQDRARLFVDLGNALNMAGDLEGARAVLVDAAANAECSCDFATLAAAALAYGGSAGPWLEYGDTRGLGLLQRALSKLPDDQLALRASLMARMAFWHILDADGAQAAKLAADSIELARAADDPGALVDALATALGPAGAAADASTRLALTEEMCAAAEASGDSYRMSVSLDHRYSALISAGEVRAGAEVLKQQDADERQFGGRSRARLTAWRLNGIDLIGGRLAAVRAHFEAACVTIGTMDERLLASGQQLLTAYVMNDLETYERLWAETATGLNPIALVLPWQAHVASLHGRNAEAQEAFEQWKNGARTLCPAFFRDYVNAYAAMVLRDMAAADHAGWLYNQLAHRSGEWTLGPAPLGSYDLWLGVLARLAGRPDTARRHLSVARRAVAEQGAILWQPVVDIELARLALCEVQRGETKRRALLACATSEEIGADRFAVEAKALASRVLELEA